MIRVNQIKVLPQAGEQTLRKKVADVLNIKPMYIDKLHKVKQSIDARKKPEIYYSYSLDVELTKELRGQEEKIVKRCKNSQVTLPSEKAYEFPKSGSQQLFNRPVIVGMGPAGLFCGYMLAMHGYAPILIERGRDVDARTEDVKKFWESGVLNTLSNVQFGEGGAGTFSDGKLNTLIKDKDGRNKEVLRIFVEHGAPEKILYDAKPHIGTDVLTKVVKKMRESILEHGGAVYFETEMKRLTIKNDRVIGMEIADVSGNPRQLACDAVVLAIGHSARNTFESLYEQEIPMEAKSFAVGFRVEHPQAMINYSQYGCVDAGELGAAPYKVTAQTSIGRGVYSFCMCPGGYVVNASSEEGRLAVNGMSYSDRGSANANSAIIVAVTPEDFGSAHPLAGIVFQRELERKAFMAGKGRIPVQRYGEFKELVDAGEFVTVYEDNFWERAVSASGKITSIEEELYTNMLETGDEEAYMLVPELKEFSESVGVLKGVVQEEKRRNDFAPCTKGEYAWANLTGILPKECTKAFVEGMEAFGRQIKGFNRPDAILLGVESRTSSPVRIHRDETLQSQMRGLYPCGEGAGYAGGITSAAMDGMRVAEEIAKKYAPFVVQ